MKELNEIVSGYEVEEFIVYPDFTGIKGFKFVIENYPANCFYYKTEKDLEVMSEAYSVLCYEANTKTINALSKEILHDEDLDKEKLFEYLCEYTEDYIEYYDAQFIEDPSVKEAIEAEKTFDELKVELEKILKIENSEELLCAADSVLTDNKEWQKIMRSIDWFGNDISIQEAIKNMDAKALLIKNGIKQIIGVA